MVTTALRPNAGYLQALCSVSRLLSLRRRVAQETAYYPEILLTRFRVPTSVQLREDDDHWHRICVASISSIDVLDERCPYIAPRRTPLCAEGIGASRFATIPRNASGVTMPAPLVTAPASRSVGLVRRRRAEAGAPHRAASSANIASRSPGVRLAAIATSTSGQLSLRRKAAETTTLFSPDRRIRTKDDSRRPRSTADAPVPVF